MFSGSFYFVWAVKQGQNLPQTLRLTVQRTRMSVTLKSCQVLYIDIIVPKILICHNLLTLMSFQNCITLYRRYFEEAFLSRHWKSVGSNTKLFGWTFTLSIINMSVFRSCLSAHQMFTGTVFLVRCILLSLFLAVRPRVQEKDINDKDRHPTCFLLRPCVVYSKSRTVCNKVLSKRQYPSL